MLKFFLANPINNGLPWPTSIQIMIVNIGLALGSLLYLSISLNTSSS